MIKAKDIMNANITTVDPDDTVEQAMQHMLTLGISGLPVVDMSGQLVGIITEFDLLDMIWEPNTSRNKVYHYMSRNVRTVSEDEFLVDLAELFRKLSIRRLLVMQGEKVVGVLSRRDLIRYVLKTRGQMADADTAQT